VAGEALHVMGAEPSSPESQRGVFSRSASTSTNKDRERGAAHPGGPLQPGFLAYLFVVQVASGDSA
jgi:hypothetical protein